MNELLSIWKHVILVVSAIVLLCFAGVVIWSNRHGPTMAQLGFAGVFVVLAFLLAIPADFKNALATAAPYVPMIRSVRE